MATLSSSALTLAEWATRLDPGGTPAAVIELLGQTNEMLSDMLWMQCNDGAGHKTTVRTGLPVATWRLLNYGVQKSKSNTAQVRDATGMLESYSDIDKALADLNGNTAEFRLGEDMAFIEAMNQTMQQTVLYGNTTASPERFVGLGPRFKYGQHRQQRDRRQRHRCRRFGLDQQLDLAGRLGPEHGAWPIPQGQQGRPAGA